MSEGKYASVNTHGLIIFLLKKKFTLLEIEYIRMFCGGRTEIERFKSKCAFTMYFK